MGIGQKQGRRRDPRLIDKQLKGTSVTVVLIGAMTSGRLYVQYEIKKSHEKGNGMLGINIHNMKDSNSRTDVAGSNPFAHVMIQKDGQRVSLSAIYPTYDWVNNKGRENIGSWIEEAAKKAGK